MPLASGHIALRVLGKGPSIVVIPELGAGSTSTVREVEVLADRHTLLVIDLFGHGVSTPGDSELAVAELARPVAELVHALEVTGVGLLGVRSGGLVALEALNQRPELFGSVTLWDPPILDDTDRQQIRANAPSRKPSWDGAHLANAWSRARDHYLFAPSYERSYAARRRVDLPEAHVLHERVVDELHLSRSLRPEIAVADYRVDRPALDDLVKVVYTATSVHAAHAERATVLFGENNVTRRDDERWDEEVPAVNAAEPTFPASASRAGAISYAFAETSRGQLFARMSGDRAARPLVLLHPSPRSARSLEPLLSALGEHRFVIGFDTFGNGESDKPTLSMTSADYAKTVIEALDFLGIEEFDLYGSHTGATIAIEAAIAAPHRARHMILDGVPMFPPNETVDRLAGHCPPLIIKRDGSHLLDAWSQVIQRMLFDHWYRPVVEEMVERGSTDEAVVHDWFIDLMLSGESYHFAYRAAFEYPTAERLPLVTTPTLVCALAEDPLGEFSARAAGLIDAPTEVAELPADILASVDLIERILA